MSTTRRPGIPCPLCGTPMTGGVALACNANGRSTVLRLPDTCNDRDCKTEREATLIEQMIAKGVITR